MFTTQVSAEWETAVEGVAQELLERAEITAPPVDTLQIAKSLQIPVVFDRSQTSRGRYKILGEGPTIFIRPEPRLERLHWVVAHELGEVMAWRVAEQIVAFDEISSRCREEIANRIASRLLLPSSWFLSDATNLDFDLVCLKERYQTASHELIAMRFLDLSVPTIITVFDNGRVTRRVSNLPSATPGLHSAERLCAGEAHQRNQSSKVCEQGMTVHEGDWKREILHTTFNPDDDY